MKRLPLYILAITGAAIFLIPFFWSVSTALKTRQQVYATPPQWIPKSYQAPDESGAIKPVTVVMRMNDPAALVRLTSGARTGEVLAVEQSALHRNGETLAVQLRAPEPFTAELLREFPDGVAQVRYPDKPTDQYISPAQLSTIVDPQWGNLRVAWTALPLSFHIFVLNTYTITILCILGQTLSCSLVAYGFARFRFRGRKVLFLLLLSTMMLPAQVTMIPIFIFWNGLSLIDTFAPLTIPSFFAQNAFFVFLLRQFFLSLPKELDEAAMIDGAGPLRIWWQIVLPLSKPALTAVAVLSFIGHWDDFMGPLIYLSSLDNYTVSLALRLFQDQNGSEFNLLMAAALVHIIPVVIVFFVAQRYFVKGISMTGMKG